MADLVSVVELDLGSGASAVADARAGQRLDLSGAGARRPRSRRRRRRRRGGAACDRADRQRAAAGQQVAEIGADELLAPSGQSAHGGPARPGGRHRQLPRVRCATRSAHRRDRPPSRVRATAPRQARSTARRRPPTGPAPPRGRSGLHRARRRSRPLSRCRGAGWSRGASHGSGPARRSKRVAFGQLDQRWISEHRVVRLVPLEAGRSRQAASCAPPLASVGQAGRWGQSPQAVRGSRSSVASSMRWHSSRAHSRRPVSVERRCSSSASSSSGARHPRLHS